VRNKSCLTAADAQKIVAACRWEAGKNKGTQIAVVDEGGYCLHLERLDGAQGPERRNRDSQGADCPGGKDPYQGAGRRGEGARLPRAFLAGSPCRGGPHHMHQGEWSARRVSGVKIA